jgi:hypothetical protein
MWVERFGEFEQIIESVEGFASTVGSGIVL